MAMFKKPKKPTQTCRFCKALKGKAFAEKEEELGRPSCLLKFKPIPVPDPRRNGWTVAPDDPCPKPMTLAGLPPHVRAKRESRR